jgi:uncharacterized phiE125 gp8 family phage protein
MLNRIEVPDLALTLDDARMQVRLTADEHEYDADLTALLYDVQSMAESELRCGLTDTRYRETFSGFPASTWYLTRGRVKSIASIQYVDTTGVQQSLADYTFTESCDLAIISPGIGGDKCRKKFPEAAARPDAVIVEYVSGFGKPVDVPDSVKRWMKLQIGNWFANRDAASEVSSKHALVTNPFLDSLIAEYRVRTYV